MSGKEIRVAIVGYGNVGRCALEAVNAAPDLKAAGVVRPTAAAENIHAPELKGLPVVGKIEELPQVDAALLCVPTRQATAAAVAILEQGINTVDCYDLHGEQLLKHRSQLRNAAEKAGSTAVIAAGWDPGTDSLLRALMELMAPRGLTFTNFGPGTSLGHSVAARAVQGVQDALAVTVPAGSGLHRRLVYVEPEEGALFAAIEEKIKADPYFRQDETHVFEVESVEGLRDVGHGVVLERKGTSGRAANQLLRWEMRINNAALTAQIMAAAARAGTKQQPGAYTLLEIPLVDYFQGESEELIRRLV